MKTDRELLELAAKAAGLIGAYDEHANAFRVAATLSAGSYWWLPHEDDGDALRLAFLLGMDVDFGACRVIYGDDEEIEFDGSDDGLSETRRAIVRAAAAIGEAM